MGQGRHTLRSISDPVYPLHTKKLCNSSRLPLREEALTSVDAVLLAVEDTVAGHGNTHQTRNE